MSQFERLEPRMNHWQRITGYGVSGSELVFGVSALSDVEEKFSGLSSDAAAYR
ncbi:MAG: hypothetical protein ABSC63_20455 [Candidatus Binataceae bacterium]